MAQSNTVACTVYTPSLGTIKQKKTIEDGLLTLSGVISVNADIDKRMVITTHDPTVVSCNQIKEKIYSLGQSANEMKYYPPPLISKSKNSSPKVRAKRSLKPLKA